MRYDSSGTLVYQYRLESRTYRMALLIASRGPSALAELLVSCSFRPSLYSRDAYMRQIGLDSRHFSTHKLPPGID